MKEVRLLDKLFVSAPSDPLPQLGRNLTLGMLDAVGRDIVAGRYDGLPFPTEAELTKQLGVSRTVTREAVKMLTTKGLLSARPRQGTMVEPSSSWNLFDTDVLRWLLDRRSSIDLLKQFSQLRIAIEPEAAALAARFAEADDLQRIGNGLARMVAADLGEGDSLEADIAFHVAILHATRNAFYAQFRDVVSTALRTSIRITFGTKERGVNVGDHAQVYQAIKQRDPAAARAAMHHLVIGVLDQIEQHEAAKD
jgi:DNA-binding FadR family transcriptional regulator